MWCSKHTLALLLYSTFWTLLAFNILSPHRICFTLLFFCFSLCDRVLKLAQHFFRRVFFLSASFVIDPQAAKVLEDEVKIAEDKFQESKVLAETAMVNFLASDVSSYNEKRAIECGLSMNKSFCNDEYWKCRCFSAFFRFELVLWHKYIIWNRNFLQKMNT